MFDSLQPHVLYSSWNSPGQNTGVGSHSLLQGIFPTQGLNPGLPLCRQILYQLSHQGSLRILEWVAYPFSGGSSLRRNKPGVTCIAGRFFTNWAMREAQDSTRPIPLWGKLKILLGHIDLCGLIWKFTRYVDFTCLVDIFLRAFCCIYERIQYML